MSNYLTVGFDIKFRCILAVQRFGCLNLHCKGNHKNSTIQESYRLIIVSFTRSLHHCYNRKGLWYNLKSCPLDTYRCITQLLPR